MIPWLRPSDAAEAFPPVHTALTEPDGLLCAGGDLSAGRLLAAYRRGIFPWYSAGQPILWWSPNPRAVLYPAQLHVSRSLSRTLRRGRLRTTLDQAFGRVMRHCADAGLRPEGTWITPGIQAAYQQLHTLGHAHSIETWQDEQLVGGLYGIALGRVFFGESMFSLVSEASKVALHRLCGLLPAGAGSLIDCQVSSAHLLGLGARLLPREAFLGELERGIANLDPVPWA